LKRKNLWAPWRLTYIRSLTGKGGCFICDDIAAPDKDRENLLLWRTKSSVVIFNRFPYNNGHLLIAPLRHIADFSDATDEEMLDCIRLIRDLQTLLTHAVHPDGFNVGMNFGRCAGAGLPGHVHTHVVPRWNGDTNFMAVTGGTDVISQGLMELYDELRKASAELGLPRCP
jgi:ATP adenylyltransferase